LGFVIARVFIVNKRKLLHCFLILAGLKANPSELKDRGYILVGSFFGILFDCAIEKSDACVTIAGQRAFYEVLECADRRNSGVGRKLIARKGKRLVMLIEDLVGEIALKLLQVNERASAIVLFAGKPALANINHTRGDSYGAVAPFARNSVS